MFRWRKFALLRLIRRVGYWLLARADRLQGCVCTCGHVESDHIAEGYGCRWAGAACSCEGYKDPE